MKTLIYKIRTILHRYYMSKNFQKYPKQNNYMYIAHNKNVFYFQANFRPYYIPGIFKISKIFDV